MNMKEAAKEIHRLITCRPENQQSVKIIADIMGLSERTVYDYLYGRIKLSIEFIKAAVIATEDPDIKKYLEPDGWVLHKKIEIGDISDNFEKEINDVFMAVSALSQSLKAAIEDGFIDNQELSLLKRLRADIMKQADEVLILAENLSKKKTS